MQASAFTLSECETNSCSRRGCVRFAWMSHTFTLLSQLLVAISGKRGFSAVKATPSPCVSERGRTYREDGHAGHSSSFATWCSASVSVMPLSSSSIEICV